MTDTISLLPVPFWIVVALLVGGTLWALTHLRDGMGLPIIAVLVTITMWYVGDVFYNDYRKTSAILFTEDIRTDAWWQVALFLGVFLLLVPEIHRLMNRQMLRRPSQIFKMIDQGPDQPAFQEGLARLYWGCLGVWMVLAIVAALRLQGETFYYFFPYIDHRADPWARGRIGTGFDSLLSFANYLQIMISVMFGMIAALIRDRRIRLFAIMSCLLIWPYFIFDRTRNVMLAILLPTILAWVFLRLRAVMWQRMLILGVFFLLLNAWFAFVLEHRSNSTVAEALAEEGFDFEKSSEVHHEGLNMFQELCWINTFIGNGTYRPNWGQRYFAEIVNPIPRALWKGKPLIGIDYAMLRGQGFEEGDAGVGATISTGVIGQGVVNFGLLLGPSFAALLMALWASYLARLDLYGQGFGRIPLYGLGLILTFNLGRDITLITLYTFVFGWILMWLLDRRMAARSKASSGGAKAASSSAAQPSANSLSSSRMK